MLELDLPNVIVNPRRCDRSICRRKGAIVASVSLSGLNIVQGKALLKMYEFNTKTAKHYLCSKCGIYTHHKRRSNPNQLGVNVACLEGVSPFDFREIRVHDGQRHPGDNPTHTTYAAGILTFTPTKN